MKRKEKDVYLPLWILLGGLFLLILPLRVFYMIILGELNLFYLFISLFVFGVGAAGVLGWINQSAWINSDSTFIYRTMFGRNTEYRFSDIRDLKTDRGAFILIMENGKVQIDKCAIISDRFIRAVNSALRKNLKQGHKSIIVQ